MNPDAVYAMTDGIYIIIYMIRSIEEKYILNAAKFQYVR